MLYPVLVDGKKCGTLTVEAQGVYTFFTAELKKQPALTRLFVYGDGAAAYLGTAENRPDQTVLRRKFSRREMQNFPQRIEYCANAPVTAPKETSGALLWRPAGNGVLTAEKDGAVLVALRAELRRPSRCIRTVTVNGKEYIVFFR